MLRSRTNRWIWGLSVALVLGLSAWIGGKLPGRALPTFQAGTSGPVVQLVGVTTGTQHVSGSWVGRILRRVFGSTGRWATLQAKFPVVALTTPNPAVVVHLEVQYLSSVVPPSRRSWHVFLADETGCVTQVEENPLPMGVAGRLAAVFNAVPRRQRELHLQFYQETSDGSLLLAGKLVAPNPWFGEFPQWPEPTWPARATNGPLVGVIESLQLDVPMWHYYRDEFKVKEPALGSRSDRSWNQEGMLLRGRFATPEHPDEAWTITTAEVADATGNVLNFARLATPERQNHRSIWIKPQLWPVEQAWRLRLGFKRSSGFPAADCFEVRDLALDATGETFSKLSWSTHEGPVTALLHPIRSLSGHGSEEADLRPPLRLTLELETLPAGWVVDLVSVRANGEKFENEIIGGSQEPLARKLTFTLAKVPASASHLDLIFVMQQIRVLEFLVSPRPAPRQ